MAERIMDKSVYDDEMNATFSIPLNDQPANIDGTAPQMTFAITGSTVKNAVSLLNSFAKGEFEDFEEGFYAAVMSEENISFESITQENPDKALLEKLNAGISRVTTPWREFTVTASFTDGTETTFNMNAPSFAHMYAGLNHISSANFLNNFLTSLMPLASGEDEINDED